ncbi:hypothetical protein PoB_005308000 [Plakobranchus ocellatus]|uniref:Uncharacterized protein n=1 Tax=Plakobranchus ocellatus TaxID=259542 RepID=A0AAV4C1P1_9GAST|nr:hypothetical protein PoB_005308000 [Plakobranchus ocellatus]
MHGRYSRVEEQQEEKEQIGVELNMIEEEFTSAPSSRGRGCLSVHISTLITRKRLPLSSHQHPHTRKRLPLSSHQHPHHGEEVASQFTSASSFWS